MKITQISVFLENRKGRLLDVCSLRGRHKVNIRALTIAETDDFGILRLVVDHPDTAVRALKDGGFIAKMTDIVAVEVEDKPGGLAEILKILSSHDLNVEYMYGFVEKRGNKAMLVFRFDDLDNALKILAESGVRIVTQADLQAL